MQKYHQYAKTKFKTIKVDEEAKNILGGYYFLDKDLEVPDQGRVCLDSIVPGQD